MIDENRYLLKLMQQIEENNSENIDSSVTYLNLPLWSSRTIINPDDYCRVFESRSQLYVYQFNKLIQFIYSHGQN